MTEVKFREEQRFRQPWIWVLLLLSCGFVVWVTGYGAVQQLLLGKPMGERPMSDTGVLITSLLSIGFTLALVYLFSTMALVVEVRTDVLVVHFRPLRRRTVDYAEITRVEPCQYQPIRQYGGWGIRHGRGGWAYNVSGNRGVKLHLSNGKHLLIGSQHDWQLAQAIEKQCDG